MLRIWSLAGLSVFLLQGADALINNGSRTLENWAKSFSFTPAHIYTATSVDDVVEVVRDPLKYPGPIRACGSRHSVTPVISTKGTVLDMTGLNKIIGLETDAMGRKILTVQAGVKALAVHKYLADKGLELGWVAEIGDATVGSIAVSMTKDSGLGDPALTGCLARSVARITYVDHNGELKALNDLDNAEELAFFKTTEGLLGIVTEVGLVTVPQKLVQLSLRAMKTVDMLKAAREGQFDVDEACTYWMMVLPDITYYLKKTFAPPGVPETHPWIVDLIAANWRDQLSTGQLNELLNSVPLTFTTWRYKMVNHYEPTDPTKSRLDFTFFEYPIERFNEIVTDWTKFIRDFAASNGGFTPGASATYFVERDASKPSGWFSLKGEGFDKPGVSFTLDPGYSNPTDLTWRKFLKQANVFAKRHGGRYALTQTRFITPELFLNAPGNVALTTAPNNRFTSAFYAPFTKKVNADRS